MRSAILFVIAALALLCSFVYAQDDKECEVCIGVMDKFSTVAKEKNLKSPEELEKIYRDQCKAFTHPKEKRLCWYLGASPDSATNILREVSRPMGLGVPSASICKRIKAKDASICSLRYVGSSVTEPEAPKKKYVKKAKKIDWANLSKMRVKQLKRLLSDFNIECNDCVEKDDFVRKLKQQQPKSEL